MRNFMVEVNSEERSKPVMVTANDELNIEIYCKQDGRSKHKVSVSCYPSNPETLMVSIRGDDFHQYIKVPVST